MPKRSRLSRRCRRETPDNADTLTQSLNKEKQQRRRVVESEGDDLEKDTNGEKVKLGLKLKIRFYALCFATLVYLKDVYFD